MARTKKTPQPPPPKATPRREVPAPPWATKDWVFGSIQKYLVQQVTHMEWVLPPFQREVVWTPEQQVGFCNTVCAGLPTPFILVWRRHNAEGESVRLVLDGQQRLTALGATVHRADGSVNPPPRAYFDIKAGCFTTEPGRWALTMRDISHLRAVEFFKRSGELEAAGDWEGYDLWENTIYAIDQMSVRDVPVFEIDSRAPVEYVINAFRAINHPGTPFDAAEIERLIQTAADFK